MNELEPLQISDTGSESPNSLNLLRIETEASPTNPTPGDLSRGERKEDGSIVFTSNDKVVQVAYPDRSTRAFSYDPNGNLEQVVANSPRGKEVFTRSSADGNEWAHSNADSVAQIKAQLAVSADGAFTVRGADGVSTKYLTNGSTETIDLNRLVRINGQVSPQFESTIKNQIEAFPSPVRKALEDRGVKIVIGRRFEDADPAVAPFLDQSIAGVNPTRIGNADGYYVGETKSVILRETSGADWASTLRHEVGHALDGTNPDGKLSQQPAFLEAWRKDVENINRDPNLRNNFLLPYYTQAGPIGPSEAFAGAFNVAYSNGPETFATVNLKPAFPNTIAHVRQLRFA